MRLDDVTLSHNPLVQQCVTQCVLTRATWAPARLGLWWRFSLHLQLHHHAMLSCDRGFTASVLTKSWDNKDGCSEIGISPGRVYVHWVETVFDLRGSGLFSVSLKKATELVPIRFSSQSDLSLIRQPLLSLLESSVIQMMCTLDSLCHWWSLKVQTHSFNLTLQQQSLLSPDVSFPTAAHTKLPAKCMDH